MTHHNRVIAHTAMDCVTSLQIPQHMRQSLFALLLSLPFLLLGQTPQSAAVEVSAVATTGGVTLSWPADPLANSYSIFRKLKTEAAFGPFAIVSLDDTATTWTDTTLVSGLSYEYHVQKFCTGFQGHGYIWAGNQAPAIEERGRILLVVDTTVTTTLAAELLQLKLDLIGDGWRVSRLDVDRADAVADVKTRIQAAASSMSDLNTLFLLGHVPVPYSGNMAPDGHIPDHQGAWPADLFYGELDGTWTDATVNNAGASRTQNHNIPGDGKFDQTTTPGSIELAVGRVDFFDMPVLGGDEEALLRRYLQRDHAWRTGQVTAAAEGIVDDNFGYFSGESFATNGWRNFAPLVGAAQVRADDYRTVLNANSTLLSYGTGGGTYTSAAGVATSDEFSVDSLQGVFTMLFGSYHGDWDSQNNFMRAAIGTRGTLLTVSWAGRPHWHIHHLGLGETMGHGMKLSANNSGTYFASFFARSVHIALLGDPTVRMQMLRPASNLTVSPVDGDRNNLLTWSPSPDAALGYHIYAAPHLDSAFVRITPSPVLDTTFTDSCLMSGDHVYMVRALAMSTSGSGTYHNLSQGILGSASNTTNYTLEIAPNFPGNFCVGDTLLMNAFTFGEFCDGNIFSLELSDATGSFASPTLLGSAAGTLSTLITGIIPAGTAPGSNYRYRFTASKPAATSLDNGFDFSIADVPTAGFTYNQFGDSVEFISLASNADSLSWSFGDGGTATGDTVSHTYAGGSWPVTLIANSACGSDTFTLGVTIIGLVETLGGGLSIAPNPFNDQLTLHSKITLSHASLQLMDVQGRVLLTLPFPDLVAGHSHTLHLPSLPKGYYLLKLESAEGMQVVPMVHE
jgi:hypothetical protein